jgi:hypothetical protein
MKMRLGSSRDNRRNDMDRRAEILAEKLAKAKAAGKYEVQYRVIIVDDEDEETTKRIKLRKMEIFTPVFLFTASFKRKKFRVNRYATKCPKAQTPTMFASWMRAAAGATEGWVLHAEMDFAEFLTWLKTALGELAYRAYAELIA